jgi:hypothetical protein
MAENTLTAEEALEALNELRSNIVATQIVCIRSSQF